MSNFPGAELTDLYYRTKDKKSDFWGLFDCCKVGNGNYKRVCCSFYLKIINSLVHFQIRADPNDAFKPHFPFHREGAFVYKLWILRLCTTWWSADNCEKEFGDANFWMQSMHLFELDRCCLPWPTREPAKCCSQNNPFNWLHWDTSFPNYLKWHINSTI